MKRSGAADLPLHNGQVPKWLYERMSRLGFAITEAILVEYGSKAFLSRISNPFWFQSFGAVLGMDWHSSGITTSVMGALKRAINPHSKELGIYICGGKGRFSRDAPKELLAVGEQTGLDGEMLVRFSKLSAKVDNTAVQDGFQLYLHNFIVSRDGEWSVVQQGMRTGDAMARRYHWHSEQVASFIETPHTGICGENLGEILNLTAREAAGTKKGMMDIAREKPEKMMQEIQQLVMPGHHEVRTEDVDLKRLGSILWMAHEAQPKDFGELLMMQGVGPRTVQSLALVSEVIHGTPSRFSDPARFSFAHGGKDGHPFPVPTNTYDEVIRELEVSVSRARIGAGEKSEAIKTLHDLAMRAEKNFKPSGNLQAHIQKEREESWKYGGRTVFGVEKPAGKKSSQLRLF
ncbi:MAG: DUF763 domain-containing protein [Flavisolibacter sp.]